MKQNNKIFAYKYFLTNISLLQYTNIFQYTLTITVKTVKGGPLWKHLGHHAPTLPIQANSQCYPGLPVLLHPRDPLQGRYVQAPGGMEYNLHMQKILCHQLPSQVPRPTLLSSQLGNQTTPNLA